MYRNTNPQKGYRIKQKIKLLVVTKSCFVQKHIIKQISDKFCEKFKRASHSCAITSFIFKICKVGNSYHLSDLFPIY